jgi:hypothetical protein
LKKESSGVPSNDDIKHNKPVTMAKYNSNHYGEPGMMFLGDDLPEKVDNMQTSSIKNVRTGKYLTHTEEDKINSLDTTHRSEFKPPKMSSNQVGARQRLIEQQLLQSVKE